VAAAASRVQALESAGVSKEIRGREGPFSRHWPDWVAQSTVAPESRRRMGHAEVAAGPPPRRVCGPTYTECGGRGLEKRRRDRGTGHPRVTFFQVVAAPKTVQSANSPRTPGSGRLELRTPCCRKSRVLLKPDSQMEPRSRIGAPFRPATALGAVIGGQSKPLSTLTPHCFHFAGRGRHLCVGPWLGTSAYGMASLCSSSRHSQMPATAGSGRAHRHHGITRVRSDSQFGAPLLGGPCGTLDEAPEASWRCTECMADLGLHVAREAPWHKFGRACSTACSSLLGNKVFEDSSM